MRLPKFSMSVLQGQFALLKITDSRMYSTLNIWKFTTMVGDNISLKNHLGHPLSSLGTHGVFLKFFRVIQKRVMVVILPPRAYHGKLNSCYIIASAVNYTNSSWFQFGRMPSRSTRNARLWTRVVFLVKQSRWPMKNHRDYLTKIH